VTGFLQPAIQFLPNDQGQEQILLHHVLCAARGEGGAVLLIFDLFPQERHRPVEMMQGQETQSESLAGRLLRLGMRLNIDFLMEQF
jgi:hypothetical protein